jgi:hypothetical protein
MEDGPAAADISGEQMLEGRDVSGLRSSDERAQKTPLLGGMDRAAMVAGEPAPERVTSCRAFTSLSARSSAICRYG